MKRTIRFLFKAFPFIVIPLFATYLIASTVVVLVNGLGEDFLPTTASPLWAFYGYVLTMCAIVLAIIWGICWLHDWAFDLNGKAPKKQ